MNMLVMAKEAHFIVDIICVVATYLVLSSLYYLLLSPLAIIDESVHGFDGLAS